MQIKNKSFNKSFWWKVWTLLFFQANKWENVFSNYCIWVIIIYCPFLDKRNIRLTDLEVTYIKSFATILEAIVLFRISVYFLVFESKIKLYLSFYWFLSLPFKLNSIFRSYRCIKHMYLYIMLQLIRSMLVRK